MSSIGVVTDSSACLPPAVVEPFHLQVVPITIHVPSGDILGDSPHASRVVYEALARGEPVKSSAPSPVEYLAAIDETGADEVMVIVPATEFTVMYRNACLAAQLAARHVVVVDSRTAAAAQGLVVLAACRAVAAGAPMAEAIEVARDAARRSALVAALDNLESIRRSGRVPAPALSLAEDLGIRPVFRLHDGTVERAGVPRSEAGALSRIRREASLGGLTGTTPSAVFHAGCPARAERLSAMLGGADFVTEFSPAMGIHTGPGVVGVAWLRA